MTEPARAARTAGARGSPTRERARLRGLVVEMNEGIVATAGIVEGFIGAGADTTAILVAGLAATLAGSLAIGGAKYAEAAIERDAQQLLIDEHRRQLALSPEEELAELAAFYEGQGLSPDLARRVAEEISERDALAAHVDAEHGIELDEATDSPIISGALAGCASALGSIVVLLAAMLAPGHWRVPSTFLAVAVSLSVTSVVLARWGQVPVARTVLRTLTIGIGAMLLTLAIGSRFDL